VTPRLVQLSGVAIDHVYRVERMPRPGEEGVVLGARLAAGGGFNAMAAARRMGIAVAYAGTLGTGPFAEVAARALAVEGIAVLRPRHPALDQGVCTVIVDAEGERSFLYAEGADGVVTEADLEGLTPGPGDWFLLSGYALHYRGSRAALGRWLARLPGGTPLVFDPSPVAPRLAPEMRRAALDAALWVSANAAEAEALTALADPAEAARALAAGRPEGGGAVVRIGARGCLVARPGGAPLHLPGHPVRAVDTTGAGDAHVGAFVALLAEGEAPAAAARLANVVAALSTTREGPATAPTRAEALAALDAGRRMAESRTAQETRTANEGGDP
jgi:sugar/nucleoside kinase (ribokinase family)